MEEVVELGLKPQFLTQKPRISLCIILFLYRKDKTLSLDQIKFALSAKDLINALGR